MLYFKAAPPADGADQTQLRRLQEFKDSLLQTENPLMWKYNSVPQFSELVRSHLLKFAGEASIYKPAVVAAHFRRELQRLHR